MEYINKMCRVCLSTGKPMQPFDEDFVIQYNILTSLNVRTYILYICILEGVKR